MESYGARLFCKVTEEQILFQNFPCQSSPSVLQFKISYLCVVKVFFIVVKLWIIQPNTELLCLHGDLFLDMETQLQPYIKKKHNPKKPSI